MTESRKKVLPAVLGIALAMAVDAPALAAAGWYLGVGAGGTEAADLDSISASDVEAAFSGTGLQATISNFSADDSDSGWKVFGGFRFNDHFAIEAFYTDLSFFNASVSGTVDDGSGPVDFSADTGLDPRGFGVYGVLEFPVFWRFSLVGKAGGIHWDADVPVSFSSSAGSGDVSVGDDGTDFAWGGGLRYRVTDNLAVEVQYESFDIIETDIELISGGVLWGF
jgi:OOP family OmpA-OmpF porin